jgi:gamma-glutamyltranspeptidase/glutathione hydrolase
VAAKSYALEQGDLERPKTGRPVIYGKNGVISSGHYLTSMVGMRILLDGGNAFDALAASVFAAAVIEPTASYSIGADCVFMFYDVPSGDFLSLSGQGPASANATLDLFQANGLDAIPTGPGVEAPFSFTVPGVVGATLSMLEKYGTCTIDDVLAPAIEYARDGIPNYEYMLSRIKSEETMQQFQLFPPGGIDIFFENGRVPEPGSLLVQAALGSTLNKMVVAARSAGNDRVSGIAAARDCFYNGDIAKAIVSEVKSVGGILDASDLSNYKEEYAHPVSISYQGYMVHGQSSWTQGPVCLQALNILENFDLRSLGHNSSQYIHIVTEALKLAFADREAFYGDPEHASVPIDGLLSKEYAKQRAKQIDATKACPGLPTHGNPWDYSSTDGVVAEQPYFAVDAEADTQYEAGTTHISVIDKFGNMTCATPSGGAFNKSVFFAELGFALSTRSEMFNLVAGHPNCLAPGKRPRTTIINYMVSKSGNPIMTVGCPGGDAQAQANLQLLLNAILWGMNVQEAVEVPRFSTLSVPNSFYPHSYLRGQLALEDELSQTVADELELMGHQIVRAATCGMGGTVTTKNLDNGVLATGADPRRSCYALGW